MVGRQGGVFGAYTFRHPISKGFFIRGGSKMGQKWVKNGLFLPIFTLFLVVFEGLHRLGSRITFRGYFGRFGR